MKTIIPAAFILLLGCNPVRELTKTPNGFLKLPDKAYILKNKISSVNSKLLSTSVIYKCCVCEGNSSDFLKFYDDGKVLAGETYRYQSGKSDTTYSGGYYLISSDSLSIELPGGSSEFLHSTWSSLIYSGIVSGDTIKMYKAQWRGKGFNEKRMLKIQKPNQGRCDYLKQNTELFLGLPDW